MCIGVEISSCVSKKFNPADVDIALVKKDETIPMESFEERRKYYLALAKARFGLAMPGVGYDSFRLWETMTMGSVAIVERGVGFDRTVSSLFSITRSPD